MIVGGDYRKPDATAGTAARTGDGGKTWTLVDKPLPFRSAVARAGGEWLAVGTSGADASADDGATWRPLDKGAYNSVGFTAAGDGWAVGPIGRVVKFVKAGK